MSYRLGYSPYGEDPIRFYNGTTNGKKCSNNPKHILHVRFEHLEEAVRVAKEHMAERPEKRYPILVHDEDLGKTVFAIEGDEYHLYNPSGRQWPGVEVIHYQNPWPSMVVVV